MGRRVTALPDVGRKPPRCPVCGRKAAPEAMPFCTPRCRDVDLNRWLSGGYAIPLAEDDPASAPANDNDA
jgi:hypothetical protein